ncbi:MAG: flavodoxin family protein [Spirochaetales bacterium]|nr:flavodoxin family protein [Spirochaetales bacterium]
MGKILILYYSKSGNTKKMAEYVKTGAEVIEGNDVRLKSIDEATADDVFWCDGIALGAPTHLGVVPWKMVRWWDGNTGEFWQNVDGKFGCVFSSSGGWGGGTELTCQGLAKILMNFGMFVFGLPDYTSGDMTLHYGSICAGEPKREDVIESCKRLGRRLSEWVAVYVDGKREESPLVNRYR